MTNRLLARLLSPLACTAMVLGTTACAAQDRRLPSPVASSPVAAEDKLSGPALWRMKDEDTTIYLFGTVHVLPKDVVWFDGPIKRAFEASGEMVTEVDTSDVAAMQQQMQGAAKLEGDQTLRELMSAQDRVAFEEALVSLGLPVAGLDQVEPWFAALVLTLLPLNRAGYSPDTGVETALNAMAGDKQRDQFETVQFQVELFDTMPMEQQLAYLRGVVDAVPETVSTLDAMIQSDANVLSHSDPRTCAICLARKPPMIAPGIAISAISIRTCPDSRLSQTPQITQTTDTQTATAMATLVGNFLRIRKIARNSPMPTENSAVTAPPMMPSPSSTHSSPGVTCSLRWDAGCLRCAQVNSNSTVPSNSEKILK